MTEAEISIGISPAEKAEAVMAEAAPEISIGISPADEAEAAMTDAAAERSCLGHFSNPKIEAYYESERPGVNVENGHRQILVLHGVLSVIRTVHFSSGFSNELDGSYEEEFLFSMLLVTLSFVFLICGNVLFHFWQSDFGTQVTML